MNVSSLDRLRELPEVFTLGTASSMFGWDGKTASHYIARWKKQGFVSSLGERTSVHFNLFKNPEAAEERLLDAVKFLFPGAVVTGASALHFAGVTTQIPRSIEIAIPTRPSYPKIPGIEITTRPRAWFSKMKDHLVRDGILPRLSAEYALADDWQRDGWRPDPDDIEWDEIQTDIARTAFTELEEEFPEAWEEWLENEEDRLRW